MTSGLLFTSYFRSLQLAETWDENSETFHRPGCIRHVFVLSFLVRLTPISDGTKSVVMASNSKPQWVDSCVVRSVHYGYKTNDDLLYKSIVVPDYSIFFTLKIYIPVCSNLFRVFYLHYAVFWGNSIQTLFSAEIVEILILEARNTDVSQRQAHRTI